MKRHLVAVIAVVAAGCAAESASIAQGPAPSVRRGQQAEQEASVPPVVIGDTSPAVEGTVASRVRALVNGRPILDDELREACIGPLRQIAHLSEPQLSVRQREILLKALDDLIDRELLYGEAEERLAKRPLVWSKITDYAEKEYEKQIRSMQQRAGSASDEEFKAQLAAQGMSLTTLKRQIVRSFIANEYLRGRVFPLVDLIGHTEIRQYFDEHPGEFQIEDRVKWQDIFIDADAPQFAGNPALARQLAEQIAEQVRAGADFAKLSDQFNMSESKFRGGEGLGQKRGEIRPTEAEEHLFQMQPGEVKVLEFPSGWHVIRLVHRDYAGLQPFDDKTQAEIRRKLQLLIADRESKRLLKELRRKASIQVMLD